MTRYELLDRIGVGGMAEIFRGKAVAAGGFEKPVAIKRILPHLSQDKRFVELLIAEAKILSLLKHRNIVQIFDVGLGDDGKYFLVMEYVDGKDLGAVQRGLEARRRRMPFDLALHIAAEMCEALEHAHTARAPDGKPMTLVHRDVSPSNVLLSRAGEIKLTDFGIAKRAEQEATGHGAVRGKFAYISPEQARNEHIDPRSDVFAVGILLWELICNRRLFSALPDLEALRAVREGVTQRPSEIDPRLSPEIDALVMSALSRDFKKRPTAGELGAKLRSMRYSMEVTVGDPATELAKIIDAAEQVERQSQQMIAPRPSGFDLDPGEMTVIRIRTADEFQARDKDGAAMAKARQVIDRFEEEETRLAQLTGDQLRILRSRSPRDSSELSVEPTPMRTEPRARRATDEATVARAPLSTDEASIITPPTLPPAHLPPSVPPEHLLPNQRLDSDEHTRLVAPRDRRTPIPERVIPRDRGTPVPERVVPRDRRTPMPERAVPRATTSVPPPIPRTQPISAPIPASPSTSVPRPQLPPPQAEMPPPVQNAGAWQAQLPYPPPQLVQQPQQPYPQPQPYSGWGPPPQQRAPLPRTRTRQPALRLWMLVAGALIMAGLAFAVTRACLGGNPKPAAIDK